MNIAGGNAAVGPADVLGDGEVEIVIVKPSSSLAGRMPELSEPRVDVDIGFAAQLAHQRLECQMAGNIHEKIRGRSEVPELGFGRTVDLLAILVNQC